MFQTPEAEALDQWFENLQNYEHTLEDMAAASLDVNFKEELSAIEQWFKVLSEAERTAALYSLLQHSTQVQIRFFITVLQQMARSDPMTALLSPAMGGSMQSQMEAKLASLSLKSPGLKSGLPASPTTRNFNPNRQSLALDNSSNFLSPDSAAVAAGNNDAAATLAQQRAKLNASHRISAPVLASPGGDGRASWGPSQLSQVSEQQAPAQEIVINSSRPKSSDFTGTIASPRAPESQNESWASMVTTPLIPMFQKPAAPPQPPVTEPKSDNHWARNPGPAVPRMSDPPTARRRKNDGSSGPSSATIYDDNGNPIGAQNGGGGGNMGRNNGNGWGSRSPAHSQASSNRFGGNDDNNGMNGLGVHGFGVPGLSSPTLGMGIPGMGVPPLSPFNVGMLSAMGMSPEQILAAQMAAAQGQLGQPNWLGMQPMSATFNPNQGRRNVSGGGRSPGLRSASSVGSRVDSGTPKAEEDVNPELLNDVSAWLRSLRLHKYTPNFEGCHWKDMVMMDEAALEAKGVAALGARRKMLKTFEIVRKKMGIEGGPPGSAPPSAAPSMRG